MLRVASPASSLFIYRSVDPLFARARTSQFIPWSARHKIMMNELVRLNVGGERYTTTRATLTRYPRSMLGAMFGGTLLATSVDEHGCFFIDRDGPTFRYVLNFLRSGRLSLPIEFNQLDLLAVEADFYQLEDLIKEISRMRAPTAGSYLEVSALCRYLFNTSSSSSNIWKQA